MSTTSAVLNSNLGLFLDLNDDHDDGDDDDDDDDNLFCMYWFFLSFSVLCPCSDKTTEARVHGISKYCIPITCRI